MDTPMIDKSVFDAFFKENYCEVEYKNIQKEFEEIASDLDFLFDEDTDLRTITKKNYIVNMNSGAYCEFEEALQEVYDDLNPEIFDAVNDISVTMDNQDEITATYWATFENLLKACLDKTFDNVIAKRIEERIDAD